MRVFPALTVDEEFAQLGSYGHTGTLNDRQFSYLNGLGLTGALSDKFGSFTGEEEEEGGGESESLADQLITLLSPDAAQLLIYDFSDMAYLTQDRAGTTPVTAAAQNVGRVLDAGPGGYHLTAVSDPARGVFGGSGVTFNGTNTAFQTAALPAPGVNKAQVFGVSKMTANPGAGNVVELSASSDSSNGSFAVFRPFGASGTQWYMQSRGTTRVTASAAGFPLNDPNVFLLRSDISGPLLNNRIDGIQATQALGSQGTGNFNPSGAYGLNVGARNGSSLFFNGPIAMLIVRFGPNLGIDTITAVEALLASALEALT